MKKIYCINGFDEDGEWNCDFYSTYKKARKELYKYAKEINERYCKYNNETKEYESICIPDNNRDDCFVYSCGNHHGQFWINIAYVK